MEWEQKARRVGEGCGWMWGVCVHLEREGREREWWKEKKKLK